MYVLEKFVHRKKIKLFLQAKANKFPLIISVSIRTCFSASKNGPLTQTDSIFHLETVLPDLLQRMIRLSLELANGEKIGSKIADE